MLTIEERAAQYSKYFPDYPPLVVCNGWLYGVWMIGNNYRSKQKFYGEYPPSYLKRVMSLFPDCKSILHLFSGTVTPGDGVTTFDISMPASVTGDAHILSSLVPNGKFDLVLADPPYSEEDCNHYGTPMINRNIVIAECSKVIKPRGFICWLDQVLPMYRKDTIKLIGTIGLIRSTNHRFRVVSIFQGVA